MYFLAVVSVDLNLLINYPIIFSRVLCYFMGCLSRSMCVTLAQLAINRYFGSFILLLNHMFIFLAIISGFISIE